jgi:hypothetical protein
VQLINKSSPFHVLFFTGEALLREVFLKTDNALSGRYLAEITKEVTASATLALLLCLCHCVLASHISKDAALSKRLVIVSGAIPLLSVAA